MGRRQAYSGSFMSHAYYRLRAQGSIVDPCCDPLHGPELFEGIGMSKRDAALIIGNKSLGIPRMRAGDRYRVVAGYDRSSTISGSLPILPLGQGGGLGSLAEHERALVSALTALDWLMKYWAPDSAIPIDGLPFEAHILLNDQSLPCWDLEGALVRLRAPIPDDIDEDVFWEFLAELLGHSEYRSSIGDHVFIVLNGSGLELVHRAVFSAVSRVALVSAEKVHPTEKPAWMQAKTWLDLARCTSLQIPPWFDEGGTSKLL